LINIPGPNGQIIKDKLKYILEKNYEYKNINNYTEIMLKNQNNYLEITQFYKHYFKYVPITIVDVERNFSHILSNKWYHFQEHNLEMFIIINFNLEK
jgi:stage III sporulation protein SpoIIIAA